MAKYYYSKHVDTRADKMWYELADEYRAQGLRWPDYTRPSLVHLSKAERAKLGLEGECWSVVSDCPIPGRAGHWYVRPVPFPVTVCIPWVDGKGMEFIEIANPENYEDRRFWSAGGGHGVAIEARRLVLLEFQKQAEWEQQELMSRFA